MGVKVEPRGGKIEIYYMYLNMCRGKTTLPLLHSGRRPLEFIDPK